MIVFAMLLDSTLGVIRQLPALLCIVLGYQLVKQILEKYSRSADVAIGEVIYDAVVCTDEDVAEHIVQLFKFSTLGVQNERELKNHFLHRQKVLAHLDVTQIHQDEGCWQVKANAEPEVPILASIRSNIGRFGTYDRTSVALRRLGSTITAAGPQNLSDCFAHVLNVDATDVILSLFVIKRKRKAWWCNFGVYATVKYSAIVVRVARTAV